MEGHQSSLVVVLAAVLNAVQVEKDFADSLDLPCQQH